jgi:hypothetical protein
MTGFLLDTDKPKSLLSVRGLCNSEAGLIDRSPCKNRVFPACSQLEISDDRVAKKE